MLFRSVAFSLAANGLLFGLIGIELGLLKPELLQALPNRLFGIMGNDTLLAIPFFILAGELMETGGISQRLMTLARVLVGHVRGGLGNVVIVGMVFFSGISGSTQADAAAVGSVMLPSMKRHGYSAARAAAIVAAAAGMGILVPPCLTMVVYGSVTNTSIGALFAAGFLPAALMAVSLMAHQMIDARRAGLEPEERASWGERARAFGSALWALLTPVIIFGGILGGVFTPTEVRRAMGLGFPSPAAAMRFTRSRPRSPIR